MKLPSKLSNLLHKTHWQPRQGIVYKSWFKGDSHFGKTAIVKIRYDNKEFDGTFSVNEERCEVWLGEGKWEYGLQHGEVKLHNIHRLITTTQNVSFKKTIRNIDSISKLGQNGFAGKEIKYIAEILNPKIAEEMKG
jgi:hypothetical protein